MQPLLPTATSQPSTQNWRGRAWERVQRFLVRRRTFFTLLVPLILVVLAKPRAGWLPWGIALALAGEMVRIWAAGHLVKGTQLTISGPFAYLRHPLYLGSLLIATGYCLMTGLRLSFPIVWALYALFFLSAIFHEEKALEAAFGDQYRSYKAQTPFLWPRLTSFPAPHNSFSFHRVRTNREPRVALGVLTTLALFLARWVVLK